LKSCLLERKGWTPKALGPHLAAAERESSRLSS
jgi:hypothetical protein